MKRFLFVLLGIQVGIVLAVLAAGPAAWAADGPYSGGNAELDFDTGQLFDSQHPDHVDCINGVCATHTGHSTSSRTITASSTNTLHCVGGVNCITNNTATLTATDTGTGTRSRAYTFFNPSCAKTLTGTATATGTVTVTGTCIDYAEPVWSATVTVTTSHTWTDTPTATATGTGTKTKTQSYVHFVTVTLTKTLTTTDTGTYTVTAGGSGAPQDFTETMSATGTGTLSATATYTATATEDLIANNPTVALGATLAQGTTNVSFSTGTSTATTTSANVGDSPKIHVATTTSTLSHVFALPNATLTATIPGTSTFVATDFATTATGTGKIPLTTSEGLLNRLIIPWQYTGPISPNVDSSYDVGTTDYKYQDGYFSGTVSAGAFDGPGIVKGIYSATNSGGNVTANEGGAWVTVASVSVTASSSDIMAFGSVSVTSAYDNETCFIRLVSDGSSVFGPAYTRTRSNYTYFEAMAVVGHMSNVSPSTITLQLSSGGSASGHTCTVLQSEGALVVQVVQ